MNILHKISAIIFLSSLVFNSYAQEIERRQVSNESTLQDYKLTKRVPSNSISKTKKTISVEEKIGDNSEISSRKSTVNNQSALSPSVPATKKVANSPKNSIVINNNPNSPIIDNLINLIEEKKTVNESNNQTLLNSSDYQTLNNLIQEERIKFNDYVTTKGIENCSLKEQNYYLSFLKEEGREQEYLENINKLK